MPRLPQAPTALAVTGGFRTDAPVLLATSNGVMVRDSEAQAVCPDCGLLLLHEPTRYWCRTPGCDPLAEADVYLEWDQVATDQSGRLVIVTYIPVDTQP